MDPSTRPVLQSNPGLYLITLCMIKTPVFLWICRIGSLGYFLSKERRLLMVISDYMIYSNIISGLDQMCPGPTGKEKK